MSRRAGAAAVAPAQEGSGSKLTRISVDGKDVDPKLFSPVRCKLDEDDGRKVLEVDFGIDDDHAGSATVKRKGDAYVVEGNPVEDDSTRAIALSVEFTCPN